MKLLVTSLYFLNDFQVHTNMEKINNFLYLLNNTYIFFIHTNFYDTNKININNKNVTLNKLEETFIPKFSGYTIKAMFYKKELDFLSREQFTLDDIKVIIPKDDYLRFNCEVFLNELKQNSYKLTFDNELKVKTEEECFNYLDFNKYDFKVEDNSLFLQKLLYFQYRQDISFLAKRVFIQKTTTEIDNLNLDFLLIAEYLNNYNSFNVYEEGNKIVKINNLVGVEYVEDKINLEPNFLNIEFLLKLDYDKQKITTSKRANFHKFNNYYLKELDNNLFLSKNKIENPNIINKPSFSEIFSFMKKYNTLNNIVWNLRNLYKEVEVNSDNVILSDYYNLQRLKGFIEKIPIKEKVDNFLLSLKKIQTKEDFKKFIDGDYKNDIISFIRDMNLFIKTEQKPIGICPECKSDFIYENQKTFYCMKCNFKLFKNTLNVFGLRNLDRSDMKELIDKRSIKKKIKSKKNKKNQIVKFNLNKLQNNTYNLRVNFLQKKEKND